MRRHPKASAVGSTLGAGSSRVRFGRAFATRGASGDADGSGAPSRRLTTLALALLCAALLASLFALPAQAGKVVLGNFGSTGGGFGQFSSANSPRGIAVNNTTGNVYVADFNNQRIDQFTSAGAPIRAWGNRVTESGVNFSTPASAVQTVAVTATGGTFTLTHSGQTTGPIKFDASTAELKAALEGISSIGTGNVAVSGSPGSYTVTFQSTLANVKLPQMTADPSGLTGGSATVATTNPGATGFTVCNGPPQDTCKTGVQTTAAAGGLNGPTGVAIDQLTGNVYVTEQASRRVSEYTANGTWIATWGLDVVKFGQDNTGTGFEICKASSSPVDICQIGLTGAVGGAFATVFRGGIAVDPTTHNVYVGDPGNNRVQTFSSSGQFIQAFGFDVDSSNPSTGLEVCTVSASCQKGSAGNAVGQFGDATSAARVAVDANSNVYVADFVNQRIQKFIPAGGTYTASLFGPSGPTATPFAVAADPTTNNVLIGREATGGTSEMQVEEYSSAGAYLNTHGIGGKVSEGTASNAESGNLALNPVNGNIYLDAISSAPKVHILNEVPAPPPPTILPATGVTATTAELHGKVVVPAPGGDNFDTKYRFEYSTGSGDWISAPVPDGNVGNVAGSHDVNATVSGLEPNSKYVVRLAATTSSTVRSTSEITFTTSVAPPVVSATHVEEVTETEANLTALVNPRHTATTYYFKWGRTSSYGHQVPAFKRQLGSGGAGIVAQDTISGLEPDTEYHFQIVAENATGEKAVGPDYQFFTRMELNEWGLPDDRGAEMVSIADKRPSGVVGTLAAVDLSFYGRASESGDSFIYPLINGIEGSTSGGLLRQVADRTDSGWQSAQLSPPSLVTPSEGGFGLVKPSQILIASPDLSCGLVETTDPLTADTPAFNAERRLVNLYVWHRGGTYELVTNRIPFNPSAGADALQFFYQQFDMADDCSRVFFKSVYQFLPGSSGIYEWEEGELRDGGVRPDGTAFAGSSPLNETVVGGETDTSLTTRWNAVTPEGSLFFTAVTTDPSNVYTEPVKKRALFLREHDPSSCEPPAAPDADPCVIEVSKSKTVGVVTSGARFEGASADGSHVFFRANYGIAATSSSGPPTPGACAPASISEFGLRAIEPEPCDLYSYEVATRELTDLSVPTDPSVSNPNGATMAGVVAIDEDGSHVYFAALGQLIKGKGKTYAENLQGNRSANIYLSHNGQLSYVTNLGQHVSATEGDLLTELPGERPSSALLRNARKWSADTSADGSRLLFTSASKSITGYDSGGKQQAYLYTHGPDNAGMITCVSCPPDGSPSLGSPGGQSPVSGGGEGFFYAKQARPVIMSEDGRRIFFSSKNVLAPGGVSGANNVYEWDDGNVYFLAVAKPSAGSGLGSYFGASTSGDDVFIATSEKLAPQDIDQVSDVYDLRVDGGFPAPVTPHECDPAADECQGAPMPQPPAGAAPPSAEFQGAGNPAPEQPKCRKGRVLKNGKCVKKSHKKKAAHKKKAGNSAKGRAANSNRGGAK